MSGWLKWSQSRLLVTLGLSYALLAELVSLISWDGATCIINPANFDNQCPPLHLFLIRIAATLLEKLSDPNNVTMLATIAIAAFTGTLWWSTRSMQKATLTSIELARAEFTATHRAKIIVQSARLADQGDDDRPAQINLTIVNTGETDATITEYTVQPYIQVNDAAFTPYFDRGTPIIPEDMKISLGEPATVIALCEKVDWLRYDEFLSGNAKLFVLGQISYAASDGIRRNTGFCRVYSKETGDWHVVKDSTYEYAY